MENEIKEPIHESKDSDRVLKFVPVNKLNKRVQKLINDGELWGLYLSSKGIVVAQDKSGNKYYNVFKGYINNY